MTCLSALLQKRYIKFYLNEYYTKTQLRKELMNDENFFFFEEVDYLQFMEEEIFFCITKMETIGV